MVQTKDFSLFSFGKHCQNYLSIFKCSLTKPFFYFILLKSSKVLTWYNWFKLNGDACECNAWGQTRVHAACSQYANALPTSSPLCCSEHRELSQMFCHDIAAKELSLLWTAPKVWEHVWIPASLRPFQDSHKCILFDLTWMPPGWTFSSQQAAGL